MADELTIPPPFSLRPLPAYLHSIFDELAVQTFVQTTRMLIFRLLTSILNGHLDAIRSEMGRDFVIGYIQAMDGEKDPRNLLMAFRLANVVARQFPKEIEPMAEELFEVTSCYFPITFKPPPGDPYGITSDDLKKELKRCMIASSHFTPFAIPLLMDKLASNSSAARRDALDVLAHGMSVYGGLALEPQTENLWKAVKAILFDGDSDNEEIALRFLTKFLEEMSTLRGITVQEQNDGSQKEVVFHLVVDRILKDISSYWMEEEASLRSKAAVRILVAAVKSGGNGKRAAFGESYLGRSHRQHGRPPSLAYVDRPLPHDRIEKILLLGFHLSAVGGREIRGCIASLFSAQG